MGRGPTRALVLLEVLCGFWAAAPHLQAADQPIPLASFNTYNGSNANSVAISGNYAYVGTQANSGLNPEFYIFDISTPTAPVLVGSLNIASDVTDVAVSGNYAYLATNKSGKQFIVVEVTNKTAPVERGGYNTVKSALSVAVQNGRAYVGSANNTDATGQEFFVLNTANPLAPTLLGTYEVGGDVNDVMVNGTIAYLATGAPTKELCALNISNPGAIGQVGSYDTPGNVGARGVTYTSGKTYVVTDNNNSHPDFYIINIFFGLAGSKDLQTHNTKVAVRGKKAFVSTSLDAKGLTVVDLTSLSQPQVYSTYNTGAGAQAVALNGPHVYVVTKHDAQELQILDANLPLRAEADDQNGDGIIRVACLGDSNTSQAWWSGPSWSQQLDTLVLPANVVTAEYGLGGGTAVALYGPPLNEIDGYHQLSRAIDEGADVAILAFGTNDLRFGATVDDVVAAYQDLKSIGEEAGLFMLIALTPPLTPAAPDASYYNGLYNQLNTKLKQTFPADRLVDFSTPIIIPDDYMDDVHMNVGGQAKRALRAYDQLIAQ